LPGRLDDKTADAWVNTITDDTARMNVAKAVIARQQKRDAAKQAVETVLSR
jgi:hypothetical protein